MLFMLVLFLESSSQSYREKKKEIEEESPSSNSDNDDDNDADECGAGSDQRKPMSEKAKNQIDQTLQFLKQKLGLYMNLLQTLVKF